MSVGKTEFLKSAEPLPLDDQSRFEDVEIHGLGKDTAVMFVRLVETNQSLTGIGVEFREIKVFRGESGSSKLAAVQADCAAAAIRDAVRKHALGVNERSTGDELNITFADGRLFGQRTGIAKTEYVPMVRVFYTNSSEATYVFVSLSAMNAAHCYLSRCRCSGRVLNSKRLN